DGAFFDRMSAEWRAEQHRCLREIERHQAADQSYLEEGVRLLELARNAQRLFEKQNPREKRRLLNFVVSNCTWKGGELAATLRQPFDLLAETTAIAAQAAAGNKPNLAKSETNRLKDGSTSTGSRAGERAGAYAPLVLGIQPSQIGK